jgi:hypothetical protein
VHSSPEASQMKAIKQKAKSDKLKRGTRGRSQSTETSDLFGDIPRPYQAERSRSIDVSGGVARIELERSKTDSVAAFGCGDNLLEYMSDKDDLASSIKPNTERASMAQAAASSTRLMSLSLGRGQPIPSPSQAAAILAAAEAQSLSSRSDGRGAVDEEDMPSEHPSIESYIGQSFPLVKNIDKNVVEDATKFDATQPFRFQGSQPQPSNVTSGQDHTSTEHQQTTPPYDQKGKRSYRQKKGLKPSAIDTAGLIAAASESTKPLLHPDGRGLLVTPPRKLGNLQDRFDHQSPALKSASSSRSNSPMVDSERLHQSLSRSGGQSKLRDATANAAPSSTPSTAAAVAAPAAAAQTSSRAVGNDHMLQQRLQEAKALSRKDEGANGAVMHKFSLWKGVQKRAPLVETPSISVGGIEGTATSTTEPGEAGFIRKQSSDSISSTNESGIAPPKKSGRAKKGALSGRHCSEEAMDATPPVRLGKLKHHKAPSTYHTRHDNVAVTPSTAVHTPNPKAKMEVASRTDADFEVASDGSIDEVSSEDESNALMMTGGGRASAFRNMVGICKAHNSSAGSLTESVKTEMGHNFLYPTGASNSIDSVQYSDDEEFEYMAHEGNEPAILGIAVDECSILSEEEDDGDYIDKINMEEDAMRPINMTREKLKNHRLSPESSSSSLAYSHSHEGSVNITGGKAKKDLTVDSFEAVEQVSRVPAFSPVVEISPNEPPPLRKGEKPTQLFLMDKLSTHAVGTSGELTNSISLSRLPTERRTNQKSKPSEKQPVAGSSDRHKERSRSQKRSGKTRKQDSDPLNGSVHKRDDESLSPALSEVSDMDPDKEDMEPFNIASLSKTAPPALIAHATRPQEEIYTIKDFQWKKGSEIIGEGTFGQVYKGLNCSTGELLAVKQICLTDGTEEEVRTLRKEIDLMQDLVHPNIVRYA